jgi:hypothetical protein
MEDIYYRLVGPWIGFKMATVAQDTDTDLGSRLALYGGPYRPDMREH